MPDGRGYLKWDNFPVLDKGGALLKLGDHVLLGEINSWNETLVPAGVTLQTHGHTTILQLPYTGADAPFTMRPSAFDMGILFTHQDDASRLTSHARMGLPFVLLVNWPFTDGWAIQGGAPAQTLWRTSRRVAWGLAGVSHATHPPRAWVDGVEQTIITAGTPVAGEIKVPTTQTAGQNYETIEAPVTLTGKVLELEYWPAWVARFKGATTTVPLLNQWNLLGQIEDLPSGEYTA